MNSFFFSKAKFLGIKVRYSIYICIRAFYIFNTFITIILSFFLFKANLTLNLFIVVSKWLVYV